jgi:hypothetical protein
MNSFKQIIGLTFDRFCKINVKEEGVVHAISDSVIMESADQENRFQIFTNQVGVSVFNLNTEQIHIDGEYNVQEILMERIEAIEAFNIQKMSVYWDEDKTYILGFVMHAFKDNYYFIRFADEINKVNEETFNTALLNVSHIIIIEE